NDQGEELVDSKFLQSFSIPVKEVTKGCFCCNYNSLLQDIYFFGKEINPEIIFAESVGSCTDLVATIANPLAEMHPELSVTISVFVDAHLLYSIISGTSSFIDDAVRYIFKKQMEEADILILNKIDLLNKEQLEEVQKIIEQDYAGKKILLQNSLNSNDVRQWINFFNDIKLSERRSLDLDYEIYGAGEAKLAWLDASLQINSNKSFASKAAVMLAEFIYQKIKEQQYTIGHLKYLINDGKEQFKISYTTASNEKNLPVNSISNKVSVLINARVQTSPEALEKIIYEAIDEIALKTNSSILVESLSAFQPGFPKPTHRIAN
ncbi:MAG: GTP-binding protein, partial [Ginsengibacter sp.]